MEDPQHQRSHEIKMLAFIKDLPNLCTLTGLFCAVLGIYYAIMGIFPAAMIGMLWAIFFDWADAILARRYLRICSVSRIKIRQRIPPIAA